MAKDCRLFRAASGEWVTRASLAEGLRRAGAGGHEILYVHTDISFGQPNPDLGREGLLGALLEVLLDLGAGTLLFPTFTFSFCNGQDFDVRTSRSHMGALNEYVRRRPGARRSLDPLMSTALLGARPYLVTDVGRNSVGEGCTFDLMLRERDAQFLFLGVRPSKCFTFSHFVEERLQVPYRYPRPFTGRITDASGRAYDDTYTLYVRHKDVIPASDGAFEAEAVAGGLMPQVPCGDGFLSTIGARAAFDLYASRIREDINYMLERPYPEQLVEAFHADHMTAL
ncbi:AAC(3) family N-acetyltransferase [Mesoterricola silvestris]|uniref:Aminoglycoside N(3)-acetyltransferase n=1 Tax=Mesoterricola silvestris TaxID=2927979 RepID=A0AA48HAN3_9BACT|nr:AAC(3) family N-acetyltransferase [Mesoterricola silvestris]BDU74823.1 hypothetical protein METEAL_39970 [Mesoterricola silvestris]